MTASQVWRWPERPSEPFDQNRFLSFFRAKVDRGGVIQDWRFYRCRPAVAIVASDSQGRICLVRQLRYPVGEHILECPKGFVDDKEVPLAAAQRECEEEIMKAAAVWTPLGELVAGPGIGESRHYTYFAKGLTDVSKHPNQRDIGDADMQIFWLTPAELRRGIANGTIRDSVTIAAIMLADVRNLI